MYGCYLIICCVEGCVPLIVDSLSKGGCPLESWCLLGGGSPPVLILISNPVGPFSCTDSCVLFWIAFYTRGGAVIELNSCSLPTSHCVGDTLIRGGCPLEPSMYGLESVTGAYIVAFVF